MNTPHISTHVLDTSRGVPVANLPVSLYKITNTWTLISGRSVINFKKFLEVCNKNKNYLTVIKINIFIFN